MQKLVLSFIIVTLLMGCNNMKDPGRIINKAIQQHGGEHFENSQIEFDFREAHYIIKRNDGFFQFEKVSYDSTDRVHHVYNNDGFIRYVNGAKQKLAEEEKNRYINSLNSVVYFALLPFKLNDSAVNKNLLNLTRINGEPYYEIKVTFDKEGGGKDHEDEFVYWIHKENYTMDFLAYRFHVNGGGVRFREAFNTRNVNGVTIADYHNYKGDKDAVISELDQLYETGELEKVSDIELKNVIVEHL